MLKKLSTIPIITCFMLIDALRAFAQQAHTPAAPQPPQGYWPGPWLMWGGGWPHWWIGPMMMVLFRYLLHRDDVSDDGRWNDALASARPRARSS